MPPRRGSVPARRRYSEPTDREREQASAFAEWQTAGRRLKGFNIPDLAEAAGYSDTQVRLMDAEGKAGIDDTGRYRPPSAAYVEAVAAATGASHSKGRRAAGFDRPPSDLSTQNSAVQLSTGDWIMLRADDSQPDLTVAAVDSFFRAWRENLKMTLDRAHAAGQAAQGAEPGL